MCRLVTIRLVCIAFPVLALAAANAQGSSEISGVVRNSSQTPLTGVRITVTNQGTRSESICYTDKDGFYQAVGLEPEYYTVEASRSGFQTAVRRDLNLRAGTRLRLDLELSPPPGSWSTPPPGTLAYMFLSALVPALVLLLFTEPGRKMLQGLGRTWSWSRDKSYEVFAARFPNWVGVPGYRKRLLRSDIARIEHPVGPGDSDSFSVTLEQAFAPMAVMTGDGEDRVEPFPFAAAHKRFLVLGGPGTGKTTLMKSMVMSVLNRSCHVELNAIVPVFVVLREMATAGHSVEQAVVAAFGKLKFKKAERFVKAALERGGLLIILDGLDEVGASRVAISGKVRDFCLEDQQRDHENRIIVTCRENSYRTRDLADVISTVTRVEPFTPQHMRTFLQGWPSYKGRVALRLYPQIQADPQILDICRNPLLLTLLAGLYLGKDKFDLPSSREAFYYTAIDELLTQRPARKQQQQEYTGEYKWRILQRIALDRLETVKPEEDPEVLGRERLLEFAKQVLGSDLKEAEFQKLLDELDRLNSIVKPAGEGGYILGHRTFQEYLAAREAHRTRKTAQIIFRFSGRPELAEVLCFYCGLIKNIPQINTVLEKLLEADDTLLAGRCLLNAVETPSDQVIAKIVEALFERVRASKAYAAELDMLSSLGQRPPVGFDIARQRFSAAIGLITGTQGEGSSGFVSALSANPSLAMKLIPGLLHHDSIKWRIQAVLLLHNLALPAF